MDKQLSRRDFVKTSAAAAAATSMFGLAGARAQDASLGAEIVKVALIGCGGRSNRDLPNFVEACRLLGLKAEIVALADAFQDKVETAAKKYEVGTDRCFVGYDAYRKVMETDAEYVIVATPPSFRPLHLAAIVEAGKHAMLEKPVAVDAPGCRKVIELGEKAREKNLAIVAGTQRRHQGDYLRHKALIDAGAVGEILGGTVSWNGSVPWIWDRQGGWTDAEYLTRNWLNWTELSGDHICEQHVHNLDVANWFLGRTPVTAIGFGGRARRESGNQYDFFSVDLDYGDGVHIHSQCRQISGAYSRVGEFFRGTEGEVHGGGKIEGREVAIPEITTLSDDGSLQEMVDLIQGVRDGSPLNEARTVAESTATAVMGRISAYTGEIVRWSDLMQNENAKWYNHALSPTPEQFESGNFVMPPEGEIAIPGDGAPIRRR